MKLASNSYIYAIIVIFLGCEVKPSSPDLGGENDDGVASTENDLVSKYPFASICQPEGADNEGGSTGTTPEGGETYFDQDIVPLMFTYCQPCHISPDQGRQVLTVYETMEALAEESIQRIKGEGGLGKMPPADAAITEVPAADLAKLESWVAAGKPPAAPALTGSVGLVQECREGKEVAVDQSYADFAATLFSDAAEACWAAQQTIDRRTGTCMEGTTSSQTDCTYKDVLDRLADVKDINNVLEGYREFGWRIEQCGDLNGSPIASLVTVVEIAGVKQLYSKFLEVKTLGDVCAGKSGGSCDRVAEAPDEKVLFISAGRQITPLEAVTAETSTDTSTSTEETPPSLR